MKEDEIMELMWQKGPVTQSQRSIKKITPSDIGDDLIHADQSTRHQGRPQSLFVQEDEMASWLNYPLNDTAFPSDFCSDLLYSSPLCTNAAETMTALRTTIATASASASALESRQAAPRRPVPPSIRIDNFGHLSGLSGTSDESGPYDSNHAVKESMAVTPALPPQLRVSNNREPLARGTINVAASVSVPAASLAGACSEAPTYEMSVTSSPGGSSASAEPPTQRTVPIAPKDRKRKGRELDDNGGDSYSENDELGDAKKHLRCSSSSTTKRSRAAEVHNLSERKRRDRINEKMKTLQELIPNCNKVDKASMLDDAIEYLKYLQLQLQMIPMGGCSSMAPTMMFPPPHGVLQHQQQYIIPQQHIGGMGIHHPMMMMMPFPNNKVLATAASTIMPTVPPLAAAAAATGGSVGIAAPHLLTPAFPLQPPIFHSLQQQQVAGGVNPSGVSYRDPTMLSSSRSSNLVLNPNHPPRMIPNLSHPSYHHHQYLHNLHHVQRPPQPSRAKAGENLERQPKG